MRIKRLFLICSLPVFVVGCADFYGQQPPAPVYGNGTPLYGNKPLPQEKTRTDEQTKSTEQESASKVTTSPLLGSESINKPKEIKPIVLPPGETVLTPTQEKELAELQQKALNPEAEIEAETAPKPKSEKKAEAVAEQPQPAPEPVQEATNTPFQPMETFSPLSPAVNSLVLAANEDSKKGNEDAASTTLERASRIEPRNATLYYKMGLAKLKSKPGQAEDLAKKAALLAANDTTLKKHSWLLVAKAREMQKDYEGAKEARAKASKY